MPLMHAINQRYPPHSVSILRTIILRYVDDAFCIVTEEPESEE